MSGEETARRRRSGQVKDSHTMQSAFPAGYGHWQGCFLPGCHTFPSSLAGVVGAEETGDLRSVAVGVEGRI